MPPVSISPAGRRVAGVIAVIGWLALALQLIVTFDNAIGGHTVVRALWRYVGYFTILTNLLVAVTLTRVARASGPNSTRGTISTITGVVLAIAIVGVAYHTLLSAHVPAMGPLWWTADRMLHYLIPVLSVLWWLTFVPAHTLTYRDAVAWLAFPIGYLTYALVRGSFDGWYPYYFIDVGALGYGRTLMNATVLSFAMLMAGCVVVAGTQFVATRRSRDRRG